MYEFLEACGHGTKLKTDVNIDIFAYCHYSLNTWKIASFSSRSTRG